MIYNIKHSEVRIIEYYSKGDIFLKTTETESTVLQFVLFLLNIRNASFSILSNCCHTKTSNLKRSLSGTTPQTRSRYIPCIVALLRLTKAETEGLLEYAGVYRECVPQDSSYLCCKAIHNYLDENDNYVSDSQIVCDLNAILEKYGHPTISE